ncbi:MAG: ABC transporter permease [Candidatus Marinimicrobia bacterium]|nr:ABC transporter permease [Candidatus Neomarinimicrobiota bacterium]
MIKNYLKIAIRNLARQKFYSAINIFGFAIGLSCFMLIMLYIRYEFSYENQHVNRDQIYSVNMVHKHPNGTNKLPSTMVPVGPTMTSEIPEIIDFVRIYNAGKTLFHFGDIDFYENRVLFCDPGMFTIFTFPLANGNSDQLLQEQNTVVITKEIAEKYFGSNNPIGKVLYMDEDQTPLTIAAVIENFPENTDLIGEIFISFATLNNYVSDAWFNNWVTTNLSTYILLNYGANADDVRLKMKAIMDRNSITEVERDFELEQFSKIHLYSDIQNFGSIEILYVFLGIGILILFIAVINFINLATARSLKRANEVGIRKVVGAGRKQLISQFLSESVIIAFVALIIGFLLILILLPTFRTLSQQKLTIPGIDQWKFYLQIIGVTLIIGLLSGSYPAFYLSSFIPGSILKQKFSSSGKGRILRKVLVIFQFTIAVVMIISTLTTKKQLDYISNKDLGFQKNQIVVLPVESNDIADKMETFKQVLKQNSAILNVTGSTLLPSSIGMYNNVTWEGAQEGETVPLIQNKVDYDWLKTFEIELLKGRNFSKEYSTDLQDYRRPNYAGAILLNEKAVEKFGWTDPIGKKVIQVYGSNKYYLEVVGVFKNFHFTSLHNAIHPLSLFYFPDGTRNISVKIHPANIKETLTFIEENWKNVFPNKPFEYYFLDTTFERQYKSDRNLNKLFSWFSILSIVITCLGLYGLIAFVTEQRTKEIGVRKVLGASVSTIIYLVSREFFALVGIATIIAWPLGIYLMNLYLQTFAYRINLPIFVFFTATVAAFTITALTISWQTVKAANANPVRALKYE